MLTRRHLALALLPAFLLGCGGAERDATTAALANARAAEHAVDILLEGDSAAFSASSDGWEGVREYRLSPEGRETEAFLEQYRRPVVVPDGLKRTAEIRELSLVTAELVSLALEPRGTWISYGQEMNAVRTRFNRARLALETGAKEEVLRNAKGEAGSRLGSLRLRIETAIAKAEVETRESALRMEADAREAEAARQADLLARAAAEDEARRRQTAEAAAARQREIDESFKRRTASGQPEPAQKLDGGNFPAGPK